MFASSHSVIFHQLKAQKITVQVSTQPGVPKMVLTGMASRVVKESKDRVIASLKFHKIKLKSCRMVINLMPTELIKKDNHLELAILAGVLASYGLMEIEDGDCFIGSLGLQGEVVDIPSIFALTLAAKKLGFSRIFIPVGRFTELKMIAGVKIVQIKNSGQLISGCFVTHFTAVAKYSVGYHKTQHSIQEVAGNKYAIRALQIAAAGGHHLLLTGPPGYGKSLMAHCLHALLPPLSYEQTLDVAESYSLAGINRQLSTTPPLRMIDPDISLQRLIGSVQKNQVGEFELARHGALFLDELSLFKNDALSLITNRLEDSYQKISSTNYPSFLLVATTNPCPCGFYGTQIKNCSCSLWQRQHYQQKLSGSLLDRIDLFVTIDESVGNIWQNNSQEQHNQSNLINQICKAHERRKMREKSYSSIDARENNLINSFTQQLSVHSWKTLEKARVTLKLSNRGLLKTIKIAQTISDLDDSDKILDKHLVEALSFRRK